MDQQQHRETSAFNHDHQYNVYLSELLPQEQRQQRLCGGRTPLLRHSQDEAFERPSSLLCR